ncbi:sugar-binding transcriptional regulator [Cryobacterium psychrophilum]|uniref:Sugar-binding transcriptional regulator n=1 Tax=Cryobacterium psychrophilum TaxID=41988 RepID=A0A4Y8KPK9_9MICO|nr:sugar-binding domain-containing protein [Cryobacterium psychrophilum]TDW29102.1 deoxyribonucleoside regulator [Cryobacterium psychrophilum]TFD79689.1 sugar-binding transcriptional regulator [Cryobacterium psychrophilum]
MSDIDELLSIRAAELYYEENQTQDEIGVILRITRWKVGRLLAQAKANGFIRIEIVHPRARRLPIERKLRETTGLTDVIVVSAAGVSSDEELQARTAQAAADYLTGLRPIPRTLGISWGRTLHEISLSLKPGWAPGVNVVQINGGVSLNQHAGTAAATAVMIAQKAHGLATLLPSPAIFEHRETKRAIESDRTVAAVLEQGANATAYLYSAGQADENSALVDSGYLTVAQITELVQKGAVGDIVGRYIDKNGRIVDPELDERTVGIQLEQLRRAPHAIAVISGRAKHRVARAIVDNGLCTVLITDEDTANALLSSSD